LQRWREQPVHLTNLRQNTKCLAAHAMPAHLVVLRGVQYAPTRRAKHAAGTPPQELTCLTVARPPSGLWQVQQPDGHIYGDHNRYWLQGKHRLKPSAESDLRDLRRGGVLFYEHHNPASPAAINTRHPWHTVFTALPDGAFVVAGGAS
jgi:hypothetical protein